MIHNGCSWRIDTDDAGVIVVSREQERECNGDCVADSDPGRAMPARSGSVWSDRMDGNIVYNDAILYVYRLAVPIDWPVFSSSIFDNDVVRVKDYWANLEVSLNEIYGRYAGVFFTIVNDERLIRDSADKRMFTTTVGSSMINLSTGVVNSIIDEDSYDIAYVVTKRTSSELGVTYLNAAYKKSRKAASTGDYALRTVAHEIGHMFGAQHTFTEGGVSSISTEPGLGQSLMSYGLRAGNYFSLPSIRQIRSTLAQYMPYLSYPDREQVFNADRDSGYTNVVCGIQTDNRPPVIDTSMVKKRYRIPKNTYFQFRVDASDPDGDDLLYVVHQADYSDAAFVSAEPSASPNITFQPVWSWILSDLKWKFVKEEFTDPTSTGTFHFWLGAIDGRGPEASDDPAQNPHAMCYDAFETEVEVAEGTPFRFTNTEYMSRYYTAGQKLTLTWNVDPDFFDADSRVRILLSTDFGRTWDYVLKESVPNNGRCEVILPLDAFSFISIDGSRKEIRPGVIKVEEIGGIAYAVTATDPVYEQPDGSQTYSGGFCLNKSGIVFSGTPEHYITVEKDEIPPVAEVTASLTNGTPLDVTYHESRDGDVISRIWEASSPSTGQSAAFEQIICVKTNGSGPSGVDEIAAGSVCGVMVSGRTVVAYNVAGLSVEVYDLQGRMLFSRHNLTAGTECVDLPTPGFYVVRIGCESFKVAVR